MSESKSSTAPPNFSRAELIWLVAAILFGGFLRLGYSGRMAIEHFDEGVYASNFWLGSSGDGTYPMQHLYAPPLLPMAIEWTMIVVSLMGFEPTGFVPMIPSLVAGIATIPSIWWIARRWFGPLAGLISAWFVSTSDFHACYSRAALTDVPVCLFILWGVYFISRSFEVIARTKPQVVERGKKKTSAPPITPWREIALAGFFTGLAWWTKYNGWLPLVIGLAGGGLWQILTPGVDRQIVRVIRSWTLIALIAFLVWSPVLWGLQSQGGYASVAANHRGYVVGVKGWAQSALRQIQVVGMYDNLLGMVTEPFIRSQREQFSETTVAERLQHQARLLASSGPTAALDTHSFLPYVIYLQSYLVPIGMLVLAGLSFFWKRSNYHEPEFQIARCLVFAWFCGMTVTTPLYHPYPRLVFPWLLSVWLSIAAFLQLFAAGISSPQHRLRNLGGLGILIMVWLASNSFVRCLCETSHNFRDRNGLQNATATFAKVLAKKLDVNEVAEKNVVTFVWGEPAVVFGLRAHRITYAIPTQSLRPPQLPKSLRSFIVFGKQASESAEFAEMGHVRKDFDFCGTERLSPSHLVLMDSFDGSRDEFELFWRPDVNRENGPGIVNFRGDAEIPKLWMYEILR